MNVTHLAYLDQASENIFFHEDSFYMISFHFKNNSYLVHFSNAKEVIITKSVEVSKKFTKFVFHSNCYL